MKVVQKKAETVLLESIKTGSVFQYGKASTYFYILTNHVSHVNGDLSILVVNLNTGDSVFLRDTTEVTPVENCYLCVE